MSFKSIIQNTRIRVFVAIVVGLTSKLLSDVIFSLIYRFYPLFQHYGGYLAVIAISLLVFEAFYRIESKLALKYDWNDKTAKRFWLQFAIQLIAVLIIVILFRTIFLFQIFKESLVVLLDEVVILGGAVLLCVIYNLINFWLVMLYRWRYSLAEVERFKKENAEFRFEMLRNQVNPHFLFNSLNTLSSLMYHDLNTAANYIRRLSEVYRYVLENRQKDLVTLKTEIIFINAYKYLFELRFTNMLSFKINIDDNAVGLFIAPMTLQMLVENAVKHNVISQKKPLIISVSSANDFIVVSNNYQPKPPEGYSSGMGLQNIKNQYAYLTQRNVEILNSESEFTVKIPLISGKKTN